MPGHPTFERRNSLIRSRTVLISCEGDVKRVIRQLYMAVIWPCRMIILYPFMHRLKIAHDRVQEVPKRSDRCGVATQRPF